MTPEICYAIDTPDLVHAKKLATILTQYDIGIKLGLEFFSHFGCDGVEKIMSHAGSCPLFLDLKFHDIPNTTAGAIAATSNQLKPAYINVHAAGGYDMMVAAKKACHPDTKLLAVTVLTSLDDRALHQVGQNTPAQDQVKALAALTKDAGLDGVVCSPEEIAPLRKTLGNDFILMTPGIRPKGSNMDDQKRVMTPKDALDLGATHLVIGRPITQAADPSKAVEQILETL